MKYDNSTIHKSTITAVNREMFERHRSNIVFTGQIKILILIINILNVNFKWLCLAASS